MDDLHSSRHLYCSLFSPRYLEKEKRTKYCNYEIVTSKVPQHTSLWYSWFKYFFRDSHYGKRYVDCRPCYSLRGKLLGKGTQRGAGCPRLQRFPPPPPTSGIQFLLKKIRNPVRENRRSTAWSPEFKTSGGSRRGARWTRPPLFLHQTEARRAEKNFFETGPPPFCQGLDDQTPPFVRVWMTGPPLPPLYKGLVPPLKTTDYSETEKVTL